ncbi:MAG: FAD-dependent oxidoreductase [Thermodesulfobacteriota bacterium]|nr:FAD-dependent oxidoreductase [Thermodesulfobacteriota bacterium]
MASFSEKSFWLQATPYAPTPALAENINVDVAIVGGGFTGLSSAYHLKQYDPNMKAALVEGEVIGFGASGRNGGFNMTLFGLTLAVTALRFGKEKTRQAHHYMERAVDYLRDLVAELKIDCDYEHSGFLRVATSEKYKKRILHEMELAHRLGLKDIEWMEAGPLAGQVKSPLYLGAWWEPRCGILNPAKLARGWKTVIEQQGCRVFEQTPVTQIEKSGGRIVLRTPGGSITADRLMLATNAYSHLIPKLKWKQAPVWTYIVLTEPLKAEHFEKIGWQNRQGIEDARNLVHYYRLTADNRLLMGGRDVGLGYGSDMDRDYDPATFAQLKEDVRQTFPALANIGFTHQWGGPVSITLDMAPAMGYLGDRNIVYSVGCMGHGVSLTHLNGRTAADLIMEKQTDLTDVFFVNRTALPWPPEPIRFLASKAISSLMNLGDRLND